MAKQSRLHEHSDKAKKEKKKMDIVPPREELSTSEEVLRSGRVYYAEDRDMELEGVNAAHQYITTPEYMQDLQHGVVTWVEAARSEKSINEEIDRYFERQKREKKTKKTPQYEL
ncbi:hypothetical protein CUJ83_12485 [Methanocella sp. CWC-04]|uniref:Uncharacterized protein n=1 Tax=Methanooceanicella nereidis TaxID=2052831 RepID=A0AAP2W816_9EURY|nr:hypothetical protein [Methanocella sp. CWC-04]MCD1295814.1 hypothetical protein [Methanocella sp. CWC-04]